MLLGTLSEKGVSLIATIASSLKLRRIGGSLKADIDIKVIGREPAIYLFVNSSF